MVSCSSYRFSVSNYYSHHTRFHGFNFHRMVPGRNFLSEKFLCLYGIIRGIQACILFRAIAESCSGCLRLRSTSLAWPDPIFAPGRYRLQYKSPARKRVWSGSQAWLELTPPEVSIGDYIIRLDFKAHAVYLHEMWVIEFHTGRTKVAD